MKEAANWANSIVPDSFSAQASKQAKRPTVARIEYLDEKIVPLQHL
jgi:hypothetical protein